MFDIVLLTKRFTLLIVLGFIFAAITANYFMNWWLAKASATLSQKE